MKNNKLDIKRTLETIEILRLRITDRFPDSSLSKVCGQLYSIALESNKNIEFITQPIWWLRICFGMIILIFLPTLAYLLFYTSNKVPSNKFLHLNAEEIESSIQILLFIGGAIFFLFRIEGTFKRKKALKFLHELRAIAHVIDMHQLTKDPKSLNKNSTPNSPKRDLNNYDLSRYLDYCCEMLSLTSKISALYANDYDDEIVLNTVNEIEELTLGLNQKIWQKIILIEREI
ncbi:MAG: hypothetical protein ACK5D5_06990 [Bacteroidota bacterium]